MKKHLILVPALALLWGSLALAQPNNPLAITVRIKCQLDGSVSGNSPNLTAECKNLNGWFNGRLDWVHVDAQSGVEAVLFSEYGPFNGVQSGTGEVQIFADANGNAVDFENYYGSRATSLFNNFPDLQLRLYRQGKRGAYELVTQQPYMPVASALWCLHSSDTDQLLLDLEAERQARIRGDAQTLASAKAYTDAETQRATSAEQVLSEQIGNEVTRATTEETRLASYIQQVENNLSSFQSALRSPGTLNDPSNPVDFTQLKGVPPHAAQGYSAGLGISIAGTAISNTGIVTINKQGPQGGSASGDFAIQGGAGLTDTAAAGTVTLQVGSGPGLQVNADSVQLAPAHLDGSAHDSRFVNEGQANSVTPSMAAFNYAASASKGGDALNANALGGQSPAFYQNASNLTSGTLDTARLAGDVQSGSRYDGRFVNGGGDIMTGNLDMANGSAICLGGTCKSAWPRISTFTADRQSSCSCSATRAVKTACCYAFGIEDPLGCIDLSTGTRYPSQCGQSTISVSEPCSCAAPPVAVTCPNVDGTQGQSELTACLVGSHGGGETCNGSSGVSFTGHSSGQRTIVCDCEQVIGTCGVLCTNTVTGAPASGTVVSSRAMCASVVQ